MKKKRLLTMLCASVMAVGSMSAQSQVIVKGMDGSSQEFDISSVRKLVVGDNVLSVYASETTTFNLGDVMSIKFASVPTGIGTLTGKQSDNLSISRHGSVITVNGWESGKKGVVTIYNINGQTVDVRKSWDGADIDLGHLGRGVYILNVNNKSFKITL